MKKILLMGLLCIPLSLFAAGSAAPTVIAPQLCGNAEVMPKSVPIAKLTGFLQWYKSLVPCGGGVSCGAGKTCCPRGDSWVCCRHENASCCGDGQHCCPNGTTCSPDSSECIPNQ